MTQYPATKKKGCQTIKVPANIKCLKTDAIETNDNFTKYDYPACTHIGTITDDPNGVDKAIATVDLIGRHIQTEHVKCADQKTGRNVHHANTQYKYRFSCTQQELYQYESIKDNLKIKLASQIAERASDIKAMHTSASGAVT